MAPSERFPGCRSPILLAGALVFALAACGEKSAPEPAATAAPSAVQTAPQAMPEKEEPKMAAPKPEPQPEKPLAALTVSANAELSEKVKSALSADGSINVHRIDIAAERGVITLYGTTDTADQRAKAAQIAAGVSGVKSVQNKLAIVAGS